MKEREEVEAESSIQDAGRRSKALAHHQRLTMYRLSVAQALEANSLWRGQEKHRMCELAFKS